jgi:outer membrane lipoprotein-sorting protein
MPLALLVLAWLGASPEKTPELAALRQKLARTESLTARFTQRRTMSVLKDALVTEGTFSWERKGTLRWRTDPPNESELVLDGSRAVLRFPALGTEQVFDLASEPAMAAVFEGILAVFRVDVEKLAPQFELTVAARSPLKLALVPKNEGMRKVVGKLDVAFDKDLWLSRVVLHQPDGDRTEITFRDHLAR